MQPTDALQQARLLHSAEEVELALQRMAEQISADLSQRNPVVVAVMNGGAFTAVSLARYFRFPFEFDYVHATRYGKSTTGGALSWRVRPAEALAGRTVLLVDDVFDKGSTLAALQEELRRVGAHEILTAVLVTKRVQDRTDNPRIDYSGIDIDDVYVFGCGMDYAGYWRGLPELYAID